MEDSSCVYQIFNKQAIQDVYTYINRNMGFIYLNIGFARSPIVGHIAHTRTHRTRKRVRCTQNKINATCARIKKSSVSTARGASHDARAKCV